MAKILRDYKCEDHGYFEGYHPSCPVEDCEGEVYVVLLKAPGIISDRTKTADSTLKGLASEYKMTDIKSTREGETQSGYYTRNNAPEPERREPRPGDSAIWGSAGNYNMKSIMGGAIKPVRDEAVSFNPKAAGNLTGPKAASYISDHQNLKIET